MNYATSEQPVIKNKKIIIIVSAAVIIAFFSVMYAVSGSRAKTPDSDSSETGIASIEFISDASISLQLGLNESYSSFAEITCDEEFTPDSLVYVTTNSNIAVAAYDCSADNSNIAFTVTAKGAGQTDFYITTVDGKIRSQVRTIVVTDAAAASSAAVIESSEKENTKSEVSEVDFQAAQKSDDYAVPGMTSSATLTNGDSCIELLSLTTPVSNGDSATLSIKGLPSTEYSIKVFYSSSASTAKGLENKISNDDGTVTWSWKIGGRTAAGEHKIEITGGGKTYQTTIVTQ